MVFEFLNSENVASYIAYLEKAACTLLHHMHCYDIHEVVFSHNTNERPAVKDERALIGVRSIARFFINE